MTLPSGGNNPPISLNDLNTEYGYGLNFGAYVGKIIGDGAACKVVPASGISMSSFYGTNKVVNRASVGISGATVVPQYKTITLVVTGGQAGQIGSAGVYVNGPAAGSATSPGNGGPGGTTSDTQGATTFVSAAGGASNSALGSTNSVTLTNPLLPGGTGPLSGSSINANIGAGGSGGSGGPIFGWTGSSYVQTGSAASGAGGSAGSASMSATGEP